MDWSLKCNPSLRTTLVPQAPAALPWVPRHMVLTTTMMTYRNSSLTAASPSLDLLTKRGDVRGYCGWIGA